MLRTWKIILPILTMAALVSLTAASRHHRTRLITAKVATGTNRFLGRPLHDFGTPIGTAGFSNVGALNSSGARPLPLTPESPESSLLVTFVDPGFLELLGKTIDDVDPNVLNIPLRSVKANVDMNGVQRVEPIPGRLAEQLQPSQAMPAAPITLGEWGRARGVLFMRCGEGSARVQLDLRGLLPNRLYSVWGLFGGEIITPFPLGGAPNLVITDSHGNASFERDLNFCPSDLAPGQRPLLAVDIVFHSDHQNYGLVPELDLAGLLTGTVTHTQLEFLVTGEALR